jgi:hypothetical protein
MHFADGRAVRVARRPTLRETAFVEVHDAGVRGLHRAALGERQAFRGGGDRGGFHPELFRPKRRAIKLGGVIHHGGVTARVDIGENGGHGRGDFRRHDGAAAEFGEFSGETSGGGAEHVHGKKP